MFQKLLFLLVATFKSSVHIRNVFNIYKSVFVCTSTVTRGFKTPVTLYEESFKVASPLQNM